MFTEKRKKEKNVLAVPTAVNVLPAAAGAVSVAAQTRQIDFLPKINLKEMYRTSVHLFYFK